MKKSLIISIIAFICSTMAIGQVSFSVSPGINLNSASVGIVKGKFNPYAGIQVYVIGERMKRDNSGTVSTDVVRLNFFMPTIGTKYTLIDEENLKGSLDVSACYLIARDAEIEDGERQDNTNGDLFGVSAFGAEAGFVAEYFFSESFSIGGKFGYRFAMLIDQFENVATEYYRSDILSLNSTFVSASLNFYF